MDVTKSKMSNIERISLKVKVEKKKVIARENSLVYQVKQQGGNTKIISFLKNKCLLVLYATLYWLVSFLLLLLFVCFWGECGVFFLLFCFVLFFSRVVGWGKRYIYIQNLKFLFRFDIQPGISCIYSTILIIILSQKDVQSRRFSEAAPRLKRGRICKQETQYSMVSLR